MSNIRQKLFLAVILILGLFGVCQAASQPVVNLSVSSTEVKKGDTLTISAAINNSTASELQDTVLSLDLPVDSGLSFMSSSNPVEWTEDSRPMWRLGVVGAGKTTQVSLSIRFNSNYSGTALSGQAMLTGNVDGSKVQVYSNSVAATLVVDSKPDDKTAKVDEKDLTNTTQEKPVADTTVNNGKVVGLKTTATDKIDVQALSGIADVDKFQNINRWDGRFLVIGLVAFVLVLVVGLLAFFMGRKSK